MAVGPGPTASQPARDSEHVLVIGPDPTAPPNNDASEDRNPVFETPPESPERARRLDPDVGVDIEVDSSPTPRNLGTADWSPTPRNLSSADCSPTPRNLGAIRLSPSSPTPRPSPAILSDCRPDASTLTQLSPGPKAAATFPSPADATSAKPAEKKKSIMEAFKRPAQQPVVVGKTPHPIHSHFQPAGDDPRYAVCNYCAKRVSRGSIDPAKMTAQKLKYHVRAKHKGAWEEVEKELAKREKKNAAPTLDDQPKITEWVTAPGKVAQWPADSPRAALADEKVMEMIARDCQPFSVVDDVGFRNLVAELNPRYELKSQKFFQAAKLDDTYERVKAEAKEKLRGASRVSFTTDLWSDKACNVSLLSPAAHWLQGGARKMAVLQVAPVEGDETAQNLEKAYGGFFEK